MFSALSCFFFFVRPPNLVLCKSIKSCFLYVHKILFSLCLPNLVFSMSTKSCFLYVHQILFSVRSPNLVFCTFIRSCLVSICHILLVFFMEVKSRPHYASQILSSLRQGGQVLGLSMPGPLVQGLLWKTMHVHHFYKQDGFTFLFHCFLCEISLEWLEICELPLKSDGVFTVFDDDCLNMDTRISHMKCSHFLDLNVVLPRLNYNTS